ncbi:MAG: hypothetical protein F4Z29_02080 [Gemmatimonadetes bacterium]|nr:hypothetical protein [Gemmatimonadota bacterium]
MQTVGNPVTGPPGVYYTVLWMLVLIASGCNLTSSTGLESPASVTVTPEKTLLTSADETIQLTADARDREGTHIAYESVTWSSSNPSVATVSHSGLVTAKNEGQATISANIGGVSGQAVVTVEWPKPVTIVIRPTTELVFGSLGETRQLSATIFDQKGLLLENVQVTWSSSDSSVVAVDDLGLITTTGRGSALITAKAGDASATKSIEVLRGWIRLVLSHESIMLRLEETYPLSVEFTDAEGKEVPSRISGYESSNLSVAEVDDNGEITATGFGLATVYINTGYSVLPHSPLLLRGELPVLVWPEQTTIDLYVTEINITPGATPQVELIYRLPMSDGLVDQRLFHLFTWHSSDPDVATVNRVGRITALNAGTTVIRAEKAFTLHDEVISGELEIRVVPDG